MVVIKVNFIVVGYRSRLFSRSKYFANSGPSEFRGIFFVGSPQCLVLNTTGDYNLLGYDAEAITATFFSRIIFSCNCNS